MRIMEMNLVSPQPDMDHKFAEKLLQSDQDTLTFAILSRIPLYLSVLNSLR